MILLIFGQLIFGQVIFGQVIFSQVIFDDFRPNDWRSYDFLSYDFWLFTREPSIEHEVRIAGIKPGEWESREGKQFLPKDVQTYDGMKTIETIESTIFEIVNNGARQVMQAMRRLFVWCICIYLYYKHHLGTPICANLRFLAVFICSPGRSVGRNWWRLQEHAI